MVFRIFSNWEKSVVSEDVSLLERCLHFRGWYVQASMELGPEDVYLLERCPHFRGWYVQASMELGPEDVSLLEVSSLSTAAKGSLCKHKDLCPQEWSNYFLEN